MARPTTPLHLPVSGFDVELYTYFTEGEDADITRRGLEGAEVVIVVDQETGEESVQVKNVPIDRNRREIRQMLALGIASATRGDERLVIDEAFVRDLPRPDAERLTEHLLKVRAGDGLPKESSTKS